MSDFIALQGRPQGAGTTSGGSRSYALWVTGVALVALTYTASISFIPSPKQADQFWIGNLAAPFPFFALVAARGRTGAIRAAAVGALVETLAVLGFYSRGLLLAVTPKQPMLEYMENQGYSSTTARLHLSFEWLTSTSSWIAVGIVAGIPLGLLAHWIARRVYWWQALILAAPFLGEPFFYGIVERRYSGADLIWVCEFSLGLAIFLASLRFLKPSRPDVAVQRE